MEIIEIKKLPPPIDERVQLAREKLAKKLEKSLENEKLIANDLASMMSRKKLAKKLKKSLENLTEDENLIADFLGKKPNIEGRPLLDRFVKGVDAAYKTQLNIKALNIEAMKNILSTLQSNKTVQQPYMKEIKKLTIIYRNGVIQPKTTIRNTALYNWELKSHNQLWTKIKEQNLTNPGAELVRLVYNGIIASNVINVQTVIKRQAFTAKRQQYRFKKNDPEFRQRCFGVAHRILRLTTPNLHSQLSNGFSMRIFQDRVSRLPDYMDMDVQELLELCAHTLTNRENSSDENYIKMVEFCEPTIHLNPAALRRKLKKINLGHYIQLKLDENNSDSSDSDSSDDNTTTVSDDSSSDDSGDDSYYSALSRKELQAFAKEGKLSEYNVNGKSSNVRIIEALRQRDIDNETNTDKETDKETEEASNPTESEEEDKNVLEESSDESEEEGSPADLNRKELQASAKEGKLSEYDVNGKNYSALSRKELQAFAKEGKLSEYNVNGKSSNVRIIEALRQRDMDNDDWGVAKFGHLTFGEFLKQTEEASNPTESEEEDKNVLEESSDESEEEGSPADLNRKELQALAKEGKLSEYNVNGKSSNVRIIEALRQRDIDNETNADKETEEASKPSDKLFILEESSDESVEEETEEASKPSDKLFILEESSDESEEEEDYSDLSRKELQALAKEGKLSEYDVNGKSSNVRIIEALRQRDIDNDVNADKETDEETEEASNPTESEEEDKNVLEESSDESEEEEDYSDLSRKELQALAKEGKLSEYDVNGKSSNVRIIEALRQRDIDNDVNADKETDEETEEASNSTESEEEDKNVLEESSDESEEEGSPADLNRKELQALAKEGKLSEYNVNGKSSNVRIIEALRQRDIDNDVNADKETEEASNPTESEEEDKNVLEESSDESEEEEDYSDLSRKELQELAKEGKLSEYNVNGKSSNVRIIEALRQRDIDNETNADKETEEASNQTESEEEDENVLEESSDESEEEEDYSDLSRKELQELAKEGKLSEYNVNGKSSNVRIIEALRQRDIDNETNADKETNSELQASVPPGELTAMLMNMSDDWAESDEELNFAPSSVDDDMSMLYMNDFAMSSGDEGMEFATSSSDEKMKFATSSGDEGMKFATSSSDDALKFATSSSDDGLKFADSSSLDFATSESDNDKL